MEKFNTKNFLNFIQVNKDFLIENKANAFLEHIKSHPFVKGCSFKEGILKIYFTEDLDLPNNVGQLFISGGVIKKASALNKDKLEETDFCYIRSFKQ